MVRTSPNEDYCECGEVLNGEICAACVPPVTAYVEIKSQKRVGQSSDGFGGPACYVAVQVVPDNAAPLKQLKPDIATRRGIKIVYFGEGYSRRCKTGRSMLGRAVREAEKYADKINEKPQNGGNEYPAAGPMSHPVGYDARR